jgi:tetratricopeptide (TPR) repeat protein/ABC-type cobalamin/Fe3+-siderophores transport system ATPase subunit
MDMTASEDGGPYVGRHPFHLGDQDVFYGRAEEIGNVGGLWRKSPLVILHGPAGSGKTSLLQAGVAPFLAAEGDVLPLGQPLSAFSFPEPLLGEHNPYSLAVLASWSPAESLAKLAHESIAGFLRRRGKTAPLLLVAIDQVEQILTDDQGYQARDDFFADLTTAIYEVPNLRVLFSLRTDALSKLLPYVDQLSPVGAKRYDLGPLTAEAAVEAIRRPMEKAGNCFGSGAAEYLVDELQGSASGPGRPNQPRLIQPVQLQLVCTELWQLIDGRRAVITLGFVQDIDITRILASFCVAMITEASDIYKIQASHVFDWLVRGFASPRRAAVSVTKSRLRALGMTAGVLRVLEDQHVIVAEQNSGGKYYRLANNLLTDAIRYLSVSPAFSHHKLDVAARMHVAESALAARELELARRHLEEALELTDSGELRFHAEALSMLGNIDYRYGKNDEAEEKYREAAQLRDQLGDQAVVGRLFGAMGSIHLRQGNYVRALEELQLAVSRAPSDLTLQTELATVLWRAGQSQAATAVFGMILSVEPESADALAGRGQVSVERGHAEAALEDLQALRRLRPGASQKPEVRSAYALALAIAGRSEAAMAEANAALASAGDSAVICMRAARVAFASRAMSRTRELLRQAEEASHPALSAEQRDQARRLLAEVSEAEYTADA